MRQSLLVIDSGSTHCFLDQSLVQALQLPMDHKPTMRVLVASGRLIKCIGICQKVSIFLGEHRFCIDFLVIPLGGFEAILGVNWLRKLGPIRWDFEHMSMDFLYEQPIFLQGAAKNQHSHKSLAASAHVQDNRSARLSELLSEFSEVFTDPPSRGYNHRIILEQGTDPVVVRPYRYAHAQKDELEKQCAEMLTKGFIRHSNSPFSSPVILVPKSDHTWRFCVDYRALNAKTVKDKFPIPIIEELLEELFGARFFSKLDLRAGYHQIAMDPESISKTAFRTHHGHSTYPESISKTAILGLLMPRLPSKP